MCWEFLSLRQDFYSPLPSGPLSSCWLLQRGKVQIEALGFKILMVCSIIHIHRNLDMAMSWFKLSIDFRVKETIELAQSPFILQ